MYNNSYVKKIFIIYFIFILINLICIENTAKEYIKFLNSLYKKSVNFIYPEELFNKINNKDLFILDIRSFKEYQISHIKNARYIDYKKFKINDVADIPKNSTLVLYCAVGYRSERVGEKLLKSGYKNIYNLYGGIFEWFNQGYEIYKDDKITNKIHGYSPKWGKWIKRGEVIYYENY